MGNILNVFAKKLKEPVVLSNYETVVNFTEEMCHADKYDEHVSNIGHGIGKSF